MRNLLFILLLLTGIAASNAYGCPCGCGSISTGTLEPGQTAKVITSMGTEFGIKTITTTGKEIDDYLYDRSRRADVALAYALAPHWTLNFGTGAYQNMKESRHSRIMPGDAQASLGYTLLQEDFTQPWLPRVDGFLSYKMPLAKSFQDAEKDPSPASFLEVGGNGLREYALDLQVTQTVFDEWRIGSNGRYIMFPDVVRNAAAGPKNAGKLSAQVTRVFMGRGGVTTEAGVEWLNDTFKDGIRSEGSSRRIDHASIAGNLVVKTQHSLGISYVHKNIFGLTRNSVGGRSITVSYQALIL